jgi:hypothetical protein
VRTSGIERGTLSAFEDLLSAMVRGSAGLVTLLKEDGIITVCQVRPFGYLIPVYVEELKLFFMVL